MIEQPIRGRIYNSLLIKNSKHLYKLYIIIFSIADKLWMTWLKLTRKISDSLFISVLFNAV